MAVDVVPLQDYEVPLDRPVNFYLARLPGKSTLIDAGTGKALSRSLPRFDIVVLTHYHWDHSGGLVALAERGPRDLRVCASRETIEILAKPQRIFDRLKMVGAAIGLEASEGELQLAKIMEDRYARISEAASQLGLEEVDSCLEEIPGASWTYCRGHSGDHICVEVANHVFVGDNIIGSPNVTLSDAYRYFEEMTLLLSRATFTRVHPGHGPSDIGRDDMARLIVETMRRKRKRLARVVAAAASSSGWTSLRVVFNRVYPDLPSPLLAWVAARSLLGYVEALERDGVVDVDRSTSPWRIRVRG